MGVANKLTTEITTWVVLIMVIVIGAIVLLNMREASCAGADTLWNTTMNKCVLLSNQSQAATGSVGAIETGVQTAVTGFQEPANWVQIIIIALVGAAIIGLFFSIFKGKFGAGRGKSGEY